MYPWTWMASYGKVVVSSLELVSQSTQTNIYTYMGELSSADSPCLIGVSTSLNLLTLEEAKKIKGYQARYEMEFYPGYLEDHFNTHKLSHLPPATGGAPVRYMTSASVGGPMGIYDYDRRARQQPFAWGPEPPFRTDAAVAAQAAATGAPAAGVMEAEVRFVSRAAAEEDTPVEDAPGPASSDSFGHDHDDGRPNDKAVRRLAQNREAARKSRLRKKAYIQTLESSRMKLAQLEQELTHVRRQQGVFVAGSIGESSMGPLTPAALDSGVDAFEMEYARWVEVQGRYACELRAALQAHAPEVQLRVLVDVGLAHYDALFSAKSAAAKRDAFLVLSGAWKAPAERFFLWIGGFRPSDLLRTLAPQLDPLTEQQATAVRALQQTARQLEDALSQGMDKLQQTLTEALVAVDAPDDAIGGGGYAEQQMAGAVGKLGDLAGFVDQADHLRQQTLRNMHKILMPRQAARGMLALADYCQRLRALSSLWPA